MASRDQDHEIEKRKDKAFERILAQALSSGARAADCPDAETLAAFYERALEPAETARWRAHFAGCSRCQQALASMAASDPNPLATEEIERLGELVAAASTQRAGAQRVAGPKSRVLNWTRFIDPRSLAPLAAAAVLAVALWATLHSPSVAPGELALQFPAVPPIAGPLVSESENEAAPPQASAASAPSASKPSAARQEASHEEAPRMDLQVPAPAASMPTATAMPGAADQAQAPPAAAAQEAAPHAPAPPPPPEAAANDTGPAPAAEGGAASTSGSASGAGVSGGTAVDELARSEPRIATMIRAKAAAPADSVAASTNPQIVWRFGRGGRIERSTDGGATWTQQPSPAQADLLAGSAPADIVCWLVGRGGTILRTTDGANWAALPSPQQAEQNGRPPDWTSVAARNAQSAVVGTSDGRRFSTTDGGKTWQPQ